MAMSEIVPTIDPEPLPDPEPVPEEPTYVDLADMTPEELLDLEDRHLHQVMEAGPRQMAQHIRGTREAWRRMAESGFPLTDEQKLAMLDEGNPLRVAAKADLAAAPAELRTWDGEEVPVDLRLKVEAVMEEPTPIEPVPIERRL